MLHFHSDVCEIENNEQLSYAMTIFKKQQKTPLFNLASEEAISHTIAAEPVVPFCSFLRRFSENFDINKVGIAKLTNPPMTGQLISRNIELNLIMRKLSMENVDGRDVIQIAAPPGYGKSALLTKLAEKIRSIKPTTMAPQDNSVCFCLRCLSVCLMTYELNFAYRSY